MLTRLSLRLRIFLFFCLLAAGAAVLAAAALWFGWSRAADSLAAGPFLTAFLVFAFLNTGLALGVWLLFDENVAKPINALATGLRLRAHSGVDTDVDLKAAKYLGDLAPAIHAVSSTVGTSVMDRASDVARETGRLQAETARLTALLTEIPIAMILVNPALEIVLYDGQAADVLSRVAPPRLKAQLGDYFDAACLEHAQQQLTETTGEISFDLPDCHQSEIFSARLKPLGADGYMLMIDVPELQQDAGPSSIEGEPATQVPLTGRPLVYDFDLLNSTAPCEMRHASLRDLCFVVFDTETTGLSTRTDDVVQLGAVRVLNGRIVAGETVDSFVNPGRPIPPGSTRIHHVTDADVNKAPDFPTVGRRFHAFARDAVLVAHNAPFDMAFLRRLEKQTEIVWDQPILDTVLLSAIIFGVTGQHDLDALCERLDVSIPPDMRHTATGDARATAEVLIRFIPLLEAKGLTTFGQVLEETAKHGRLLKDLN
jgi:DNA polymerase-3 subunit epsilon